MNTILYTGLSIIFIGFLFFIYAVHSIAKYERELYRQKELNKSFMENKKKEKNNGK
tara:strand:- start:735 stop:902 length:168 start_codon:yes stop_codon:yes gene_type:complete